MDLLLKITGSLLIVLSVFHLGFPRYFDWKNDLKNISLINRQMLQVHTLFIGLVVFLIGLLCLISTEDIINTSLGKTISLGLGIFWSVRFLIQFFMYSSKLWRGKYFETALHILFSLLWIFFSAVFFTIYFS